MRGSAWLCLALGVAVFCAAAPSCKRSTPPAEEQKPEKPPAVGKPDARLYLSSTIAGALEPCGCSEDQLGGLDHLAAYVASEKEAAPHALVLSAGPMLYVDPELEEHHATQDRWKAETIAGSMDELGLSAWTPGRNDFAVGAEDLDEKTKQIGGALLGAGLAVADGGSRMYELGTLKVGVVGVSDPKDRMGRYPEGLEPPEGPAHERVDQAVASLKKKGANLLVAMAALPRGEALRIADKVPELHLLLIGKPYSRGHANTDQPPPSMIGDTLVVETANHGQTVGVVDVFVRGDPDGRLSLADAGGVERATKINAVSGRIRDLEARINSWEKGGDVDPEDLAARKKDLAELREKKKELASDPPAPEGSFFRYRVKEVREEVGVDAGVRKKMRAFYKKVNAHNEEALADLEPPEVPDGEAGYVGLEECALCHAEEKKVWKDTAHAQAYETLEKGFKEYNLECVGCHVTGYGKPGGSTVTHNEGLKDVQCETCHGPGSLHASNPEKDGLITLKPDPSGCVEQCHHPPHVDGFDPKAKMELILGPGHGR